MKKLSDEEKEMVGAILAERGHSSDARIIEMLVRMAAAEGFAVNSDKIKKKKKVAMKNRVEKAARNIVEWEAEEASGDESIDRFE